ncbi:MAG: class I SAM-dependent methyltransferase [Clostridium sp.]|nr:class I SAM-dependent methyltransferase [Clostridium sp.]
MGNINLSDRMEAVVSMVSSQSFAVADVGCDHAYVSIALVRRKITDYVIATDVRKGPLAIAWDNVRAAGLEKEIDLRLGDGLEKLVPGEVDNVVIAGIGGLLMKSILERGGHILGQAVVKRPVLVLQPQSDLQEVRIFLYHHAYHIVREKMLLEDGKYYTVMRAEPCSGETALQEGKQYTPAEWLYGMDNLQRQDRVLYTYLQNEGSNLREVSGRLADEIGRTKKSGREPSARIQERWRAVQENMQINEAAFKYYG